MQCACSGTEAEAGTSLTFYFGTHARANVVHKGTPNSTPVANQVVGSEQVFLCSSCQIAARHRAFREAVLICGVVIVLSPAIVGLLLFPSLVPAWSALTAFLRSVPVAGIVIGVGGITGLGLLARAAMEAFGGVVWIACTWQKPYALTRENPNFDKTAEGEACAISMRRAALKRQGYDACFTRKAYSSLGRTARVGRIASTFLVPVGLFVLGLFTLACIGVGGLLVSWLH